MNVLYIHRISECPRRSWLYRRISSIIFYEMHKWRWLIFFSEKYNILSIKVYKSFIIIFFSFLYLSMNYFNDSSLIMNWDWSLNEGISDDLKWMISLKRMIDAKSKAIIEFITYIEVNYSIFSLRWSLFMILTKVIIIVVDFLFLYLRFRDYNWYNTLLNIESILYSFDNLSFHSSNIWINVIW